MLQIRFHSLITSALILGLLSGGASAATYTWDGAGGSNALWSSKQNWAENVDLTGGTPHILIFDTSLRVNNTNDVVNLQVSNMTFNATAGLFVLGGTNQITFTAGGITNNSTNLQTISMALGLNATITVATTSGNVALGGAISGTGGLTKTGTNTLTLSGASNYSGATSVDGGTLLVNGSITSTTTVKSTATIGGSGTTGALTVQTGGFISGGDSIDNTSVLNINGNYSQAGQYTADIAAKTAGNFDQLNVTGTVNITGGSLVTSFTGSYSVNDIIFILLNDGVDAISGTYAGLAQGATFTGGGSTWQISYIANNTGISTGTFTGGNDIAIMAIPEPSAVFLGGLGTVLLLLRRRRSDYASE